MHVRPIAEAALLQTHGHECDESIEKKQKKKNTTCYVVYIYIYRYTIKKPGLEKRECCVKNFERDRLERKHDKKV